jgi:hypothetical protein
MNSIDPADIDTADLTMFSAALLSFASASRGERTRPPERDRSGRHLKIGIGVAVPPWGDDVRVGFNTGSTEDSAACPVRADTVEKVENRMTPKISQMPIFGQLRR